MFVKVVLDELVENLIVNKILLKIDSFGFSLVGSLRSDKLIQKFDSDQIFLQIQFEVFEGQEFSDIIE